ncbi:FAD-dependent monooxygenase [Altererythrobacter sp. MF3-039]|uniref:FAD-dependent monooxygenase n=1 Tax=Altererythrobacter sp. MF3-039 TaxID=3252901 RepID=UPI00390C795A
MRILIIGAGLGGLTAAITLARAGFEVSVHEAATELGEVGAGLTLGFGAQHVFRALDLQRHVAASACPAGNPPFVHFRSGEILMGAKDPGQGLPDDGEANIVRHIYRVDLQRVLSTAARAAGAQIHTGQRLVDLGQDAARVTAEFADGSLASGDLLIGADGVRSRVRTLMRAGDEPRFTNHVAYRFLVPIKAARPFLSHGRSAIFIGPGRTFNRYTMAKGRIVNGVGLVETDEQAPEGWSQEAPIGELRAAFAGWHKDVTGIIEQGGQVIKWGLYDRAPLDKWSWGRVALLGDAAHAMLPFLGLGAAMAVEDGYILGRALEQEGGDIGPALARYDSARIPRTTLVQQASKVQGEVTQSIDPDAFGLAKAPLNNRDMMEFDPVADFG